MKNIILILFLLIPNFLIYAEDKLQSIPLSKLFWSLYRERNIVGKNDCSNKCGRYLRALIAKGYKAEIIILRPHRSRYLHSVVKIIDNQLIKYIDPTKGIMVNNLAVLGNFQRKISYEHLDKLGPDFR